MELGTQRELKSWAMFAISGVRLRPLEVTEKLGLTPDYYHGGDVKDIENMTIPSHWQLNSKLGPEFSPQDHIWDILKVLGPVRQRTKRVHGKLRFDDLRLRRICFRIHKRGHFG